MKLPQKRRGVSAEHFQREVNTEIEKHLMSLPPTTSGRYLPAGGHEGEKLVKSTTRDYTTGWRSVVAGFAYDYAVPTALGAQEGTMELTGFTFTGDAAVDMITPSVDLDVVGGTLNTFKHGIYNGNEDDAELSLRVRHTSFVGGENSAVAVEAPTRDFQIVGARVTDGKGYAFRQGFNDDVKQDGWKGGLFAFNYVDGLASTTAPNAIAGVITYAHHARVIGNDFRDIVGASANDCAYVYTKSIGAIVGFNVGTGITSDGTPQINSINLKGDKRADTEGNPLGYGAMAVFNSLKSGVAGVDTGIQCESDEQAAIGNYIEDFNLGIGFGSGDTQYSQVALNRVHNSTGGATSYGVNFGAVKGWLANTVGNILKGFRYGVRWVVNTGETFDGISHVGDLIEGEGNTVGSGFDITSDDAGGISNLSVVGPIIKDVDQPFQLTNVSGVYVTAPRFINPGTSTRPYYFTTCKNIRGVQAFNATAQTTDATNTNVFQIGISDGNVLKVTMHALARKSDGSAVASLRRDFLFKQEGGTATLVASGTLVSDGGTALDLNAAITSNRCMTRIAGIAAETWDWTINYDFELHGT